MAKTATTANPGESSGAASPPSKVLGPKLKIAAFILGVAAVEWVVAYVCLPSVAPATVPAQEKPAAEESHEAEPVGDSEGSKHGVSEGLASHAGTTKSHGSTQEVDLGEFTVTAYQPVSSSTLFISFHLYGSVTERQAEEFAKRMEDNKHRIRDNVIVIVRSAEITDLTDAGLGLIKRRILETTNKALGKPLLQGVMFSEFSFVEQ
jgi:flagellar basal body-associated protein FliL